MPERTPYPGEIPLNELELLKALSEETGDGEIKLDYYVLQLGEHIGLTKGETTQALASLVKQGYLRQVGTNQSIAVSQLGRELVERAGPQRASSAEITTRENYSIFISHIHENEEVAKKLKEYLISIFSDKISVFISGDPENIAAGQDWFATIIDGIKQCDCMIILCSPHSVERKWIYFEAGAATILDRKIIPICFAGLNPGALPSPLNFIRSQAIDSDDAEKLNQHFEILIRKIAERTGGDGPLLDVLQSDRSYAVGIKENARLQ